MLTVAAGATAVRAYRAAVIEVDPGRLGDPADVDPVQGQRLLQL